MSMFAPKKDEPKLPQKSRFHIILDHYKQAQWHMEQAAHLLSTLTFDTEKGVNFAGKFIHDLTQTIQDFGGTINEVNVEEEIKAYAPKRSDQEGQV